MHYLHRCIHSSCIQESTGDAAISIRSQEKLKPIFYLTRDGFITLRKYIQGGLNKVRHYHESSLNRINTRH